MMDNMTPTVKQLLIINIMVFIGAYFIPNLNEMFALHNLQDPQFQIWQIITHMFMHANIMHIAFNMFALVSFGSLLEHFWGGKKFLFFYISCGLGAALLQLGINYLEIQHFLNEISGLNIPSGTLKEILSASNIDEANVILHNSKIDLLNVQNATALGNAFSFSRGTMVGASGAIYGLMVAFAFMFPTAELAMFFIPVPIKAKYFVPGIIGVDLILGIYGSSLFGDNSSGGGIAHFAHIGGAIIGFIMMWYWKKTQFNNRRWN